MKRLFEVNGVPFANKMLAKKFRDAYNKEHNTHLQVHLGIDHRLYGVRSVGKTHSHNAHSGGHGNGFPRKARRFN